jgi:High potential iron-sulfur protein
MSRMIRRRALLKAALMGVASAPLAAQLLRAGRADAAETIATLSETSKTAQSLGYVADASKVDTQAYPNYRPGQTCRNCSEYLGEATDAQGGCTLVLGEYVLAGAWCKAWAQKPGA